MPDENTEEAGSCCGKAFLQQTHKLVGIDINIEGSNRRKNCQQLGWQVKKKKKRGGAKLSRY